MEPLHILEQKITQLVELVKHLQSVNTRLLEENNNLAMQKIDLAKKIEDLETCMLTGTVTLEEEKALTKMVVDDLIKSIDSLVSNETVS